MQSNLWKECLNCKDKCCKWNLAFPLFLTPKEKGNSPKINIKFPCIFFNKKGLCDIHNKRPFDCRFFPFDVHNINGKFFWIVWKVNCPILDKEDFEPYLKEHEQKLIPTFMEYLKDYEKFRQEEFLSKYEYIVLREIKI